MKRKLKKILNRRPKAFKNGKLSAKLAEFKESEELQSNVPRITNETIAEHREKVIKKAKKYILPLPHSKHRIVIVTASIVLAAVAIFFSYCSWALYKSQSSSTFLYRVTQVVPFPVARTGSRFVAYENYLFELRHYTHYYQNQLKTDFNDPKNRPQLVEFKRRALDKVINDVYVKQLAEKNGVAVTDGEVDNEIRLVRAQNRLGNNDKVFEDVLKDYWGWSVSDFKRSLKSELLAQKVAAKLDTETESRASAALAELKNGVDFAEVAKKYSEDENTKPAGGEFGFPIDQTSRDLSAQTTDALFRLKPGQFSEVINVGYGLEIVKNIEITGNKIRGAHILFNFKDISGQLNDLRDKHKSRVYISVPDGPADSAGQP